MKKMYAEKKWSVFALLVLLSYSSFAQLGKLDSLYYGGKGIDFKCTGGIVLPDSSLIVTGKFLFANERQINGIAQLTKEGEIDYSFNTGTGADEHVNVAVRQPDGKLIIGGDFITFNGQIKNRIARLNADGSLDGSFNSGTGVDGSVYAIYLQDNGKIILAGGFLTFNGDSVGAIVRLNSDGTHDFSFLSNTGFDGPVYSVDRQADKKFIVGGFFSAYHDSAANNIARLDSNGVFDTTFNIGGAGASDLVTNATVLPNGKIIAAGFFSLYNNTPASRVVRINSDGSLDNTFVTGSGFNSNVNELAIQPDGKILFTGSFTQYNSAVINRIARLDTTGTLDATFNPGLGPNLSCNAVFLNPDGKIYSGGTFVQVDSFARLRLARLHANGSVDQSFMFDSKLNGQILSIAFQSSGKAIIGGQFTNYNNQTANRIARLNSDGSLDNTFVTNSGAGNIVRAVAVTADDKVLVAGDFTTYNGSSAGRLVRLNADGTPDNTFTPGTGANNAIYSVTILSGNKILITGNFTQYNGTTINRIARLNSNGTLDNTFTVGTGFGAIAREVAVQPDGKLIIAGSFTAYNGNASNRIVRIDSNGVYDNTFAIGTGANNIVYAVALQPDGKVVIGGVFTAFNSNTVDRIARLDTNGSFDNTYSGSTTGQVNEIFPVYGSSFFPGGMLVAGVFTTINNEPRNRIVLLDNNGNIDSTNYYVGAGADGTVNVIADNKFERKLFVGGDFKAIQNHVANRLAALQNGYIRVQNISASLCPGASTKIYFSKAETFFGNNVFTVQMSDSVGNFTNAVNVGTQNSVDIGADSATITIPSNTPDGNGYRFRIVSSNPQDTSNLTLPVEISSQSTATITPNGATTFCSDGQLTITATAGDQYLWSSGETTQSITVNTSSNYIATVTSAGCAAVSNTVTVNVLPAPDSSVTIVSVTICNGGTATLEASPGLTYLWSTTETDSIIQITQSGSYSITVSNGSCAADSTVVVNLSSASNLASTTDPTTFCAGGTATLTSVPGLTYLWSTGASTQSITVNTGGDYDVTVNDGTCADTSQVISITVNALPNVSVDSVVTGSWPLVCIEQNPVVVLASGTPAGGNYSGSSFVSNDTLYASSAYTQGTTSFTLYYTYTDGNGCFATDSTVQSLGVCAGINEGQFSTISISPNPGSNTLYISSSVEEIKNVEVLNMLGEIVLSKNSEEKRSAVTLNISQLAAGTYFIKTGEKKFRFIKID